MHTYFVFYFHWFIQYNIILCRYLYYIYIIHTWECVSYESTQLSETFQCFSNPRLNWFFDIIYYILYICCVTRLTRTNCFYRRPSNRTCNSTFFIVRKVYVFWYRQDVIIYIYNLEWIYEYKIYIYIFLSTCIGA